MSGRACDFLFAAACVVPGSLFVAGEPGLAVLAFVFLALAAMLCGLADPAAPHRVAVAAGAARAARPAAHRFLPIVRSAPTADPHFPRLSECRARASRRRLRGSRSRIPCPPG